MAEKLLDKKVIFITGGAHGIGYECAKAYAHEGANVVIADINYEAAQVVADEMPTKGFAVKCDVTDYSCVEDSVSQTLAEFGRLDVVHNYAGIAKPAKHLHETTEDEWDALHSINLKSVYYTTRAAIDALKESKGNILNTASMVGIIGQKDHAAYVSTKGAMVALTKAMAIDYAPDGIRVNAVCPAGVWTPMLRAWVQERSGLVGLEQYMDDIHILGYCPEGDVIADAATFLISDKARFITGCLLPVSGGAELGYRR